MLLSSTTDPTSVSKANGGPAMTMAFGQLVILFSFTGVTVFLIAIGRDVPGELWTLNVAIVAYFLGQKVPFATK